VISRRAVSEFPNDNPELHDGLVWVCPEPRGRALPTLRFRPHQGPLPKVLVPSWSQPEAEPQPHQLREPITLEPITLEPEPAEFAEPVASEPDPVVTPADSPFDRFTAALSRVAMARGATRAGAAAIALLTTGRVGSESLSPMLLESLVRRGILVAGTGHVSPSFAATTRAWRAVLEGTDADLSACGSTLLDAWAAELLATVMGSLASEVAELKRELRREGVAAFGLLAVA
jgi:hypothetical protein